MNPLASKQVLQALTEIESQQLAVRQKSPDWGLLVVILRLTEAWELLRPYHIPIDGSRVVNQWLPGKNLPGNTWLSNLPV